MSSSQPTNKQASEGVTIGDDFVIHAKHTCDKCYTRPIVGKRYTSGVVADFDLCEKCFKEYDGPEMAFSETLLARDKATKNSFVMKLKIECGVEEAQTRRINVAELWDPSASVLSFNKLMSIASRFAAGGNGVKDTTATFDPKKARVTYIDEDGDKITISSNEELMDSFVQTVKKQPFRPFRVTVSVDDSGTAKSDKDNKIYFSMSNPCKTSAPIGGPHVRARYGGRCGRFRNRDAAVTEAMSSPVDPPIPGHTSNKEVASGLGSDKSSETPKPGETPSTEKSPAESPTSCPSFIHARHTCDGCSKTPIIGTRYHATKIPDFDLCEACYTKYEGEDLDFKQETLGKILSMVLILIVSCVTRTQLHDFPLDIDCRMQSRWLKRQLARSAKATKGIVDLMKLLEAGAKVAVASQTVEPHSPDAIVSKKEEGEKNKAEEKTVDTQGTSVAEPEGMDRKTTQEEKPVVLGASLPDGDQSIVDAEVKERNTTQDSASDEKRSKADSSASLSSNTKSNDDSFLSDAEGHGSIAEVIGRTLDVCVQAMEEAMTGEFEQIKNIDAVSSAEKDVAAIVSAAVDTYSVASSVVSNVTDILKRMEDSKTSVGGTIASDIPADMPSTVSGATILKSVDDQEAASMGDEVHVEDASVGDDGWSVVDDNKKEEKDEFSGAAEMIGSFLYNSGVMSAAEKGFDENGDSLSSDTSKEPLSPVVLAKWDAELKTLHELGFLDERKNVDVLEHLEAAHVGCDSTDKVTVNGAVDILLGEK
eukprot:CCRYP_005987-RB/>CCRYP_005987-RB protein AED:0.03 eAED:0.03 QI:148/1/1/1/1/0.75/4/727/761